MALPIKYSLRNIVVRWRATLATIGGVALVVFVYLWMQAMASGLDKAAVSTGDPRNLLIVRKGADSESTSQVKREDLGIIQYSDEIARDAKGQPLISADFLTVVYLQRQGAVTGGTNVTFRGVSPNGRELRPQVKLTAGRWPQPGNREVTISQRLAARFANTQVGGVIEISKAKQLKVVGHFDAGGSAFDSEAWMDSDEARSFFNRDNYSSLLVRPASDAAGQALAKRLEADKRMVLRVKREVDYYSEQTKTSEPIRFMGNFLAVAMSIGAVCAAMNTMYASVGARTREFGTLRVLGFRRRAVVLGILLEGAGLALIGGALGCLLAQFVNGYRAGTINFATFSETVFELHVTPELMGKGLIFSAIVGLVGSLLPALRAARMPVITALKAA